MLIKGLGIGEEMDEAHLGSVFIDIADMNNGTGLGRLHYFEDLAGGFFEVLELAILDLEVTD
jgi:hypothetical protein